MATEEQIRNYAHLLWEKAGRPEGRAEEFWHAAEFELNAESESPDAPTEDNSTDETPSPNDQASKLTRVDQPALPTVARLVEAIEPHSVWINFHPAVGAMFDWWVLSSPCWRLWYSSYPEGSSQK
jgi:hypothetical protein